MYQINAQFPNPTHQKVLVSGVPIDSKLTVAEGHIFSFSLSLWDAKTIPSLPWTVLHAGPALDSGTPAVWLANAADRSLKIRMENTSDARTASMQDEAGNCWSQLILDTKKRANWLNFIGAHRDTQRRALAGITVHTIYIRTLQDDFLARAFAQGSAEVSCQVEMLVNKIGLASRLAEQDKVIPLEEFLWPEHAIPSWAAGHYAGALNNFKLTVDSFSESKQ